MITKLYITDEYLQVRQAVVKGYIECPVSGKSVVDLSFPTSKLRRGRVQNNGGVSPTITTTGGLYVIEEVKNEDK